jgi:DDE superfamily endonuclease
MHVLGNTGTEGVMVAEHSGLHRAGTLASMPAHYAGRFQFHLLPTYCGHHLNPVEGIWRVMQEAIGAGRCLHDPTQLYKRTRQVLMAHQERPISEFHG